MLLTDLEKTDLKDKVAHALSEEREVRKIVVFGSFVDANNPHDMDIAVFEDGDTDYLTLALKYRRKLRTVARRIPVDVIPIKATNIGEHAFLDSIAKGETIYEG